MSVKVCPECGAEYVLSVEVCADDGAELVLSDTDEMEGQADEERAELDDLEAAGLDGSDETADRPSGDQIAYELDEWDNESRVLLGQLLVGETIRHVWEAGTLVVRTEDEARVDELVEQVELSTQPLLDPDKEQVSYDLQGWPDEKREALAESLLEAEVPFGFEESGDVAVHAEDEERVEAILDQVDFNFTLDADAVAEDGEEAEEAAEAGEDDDEDGLVAQEAMGALFVAADRLMHDPDDSAGVLGMVDGSATVADLAVPYGFAPGVWADIQERSAALKGLLEAEGSDDDAVMEAARELRTVLRQFV